jgi:hypothetical protein
MKKILPNLFFIFLSAPILSPQVGGITIYVYAIITLLDIRYWLWVYSNIEEQKMIGFLVFVGLIAVTGFSAMIFFKIFMLALSVSYCVYCYISNLFYLYRYAVISVLVASLQFVLLMNHPELARLIGPTSIAHLVWGDYGTASFTNFYAINILPRVSGLCREGGFFASYLVVVAFIAYFDKFLDNRHKKLLLIFLVVGLIFSLSKSTIILIIVPIVFLFKKYIKIIPIILMGVIISIIASVIFSYIQYNSTFFSDVENLTFIHRFSGYAYMQYVHLEDLLMGVDYATLFKRPDNFVIVENYDKYDFCGFPNIYLKHGVISFLFFLLLMTLLGFSSMSIILIFLLTITVSPWTCDNFVVLSWLLCLRIDKSYLFHKKKVKTIY